MDEPCKQYKWKKYGTKSHMLCGSMEATQTGKAIAVGSSSVVAEAGGKLEWRMTVNGTEFILGVIEIFWN